MCAERGLSSDNLKKDEILKQLIIYNQSKSPKSTSPIVEETRWWSDPNSAGWINLTLSQLHLVKYEELKNHLYNRGHLITVIEHLHVYEPEAIYIETWETLMICTNDDVTPTLQEEVERLFRTTLLVFKTM